MIFDQGLAISRQGRITNLIRGTGKETLVKDKSIIEKLGVLIHHWISHNEEHAQEYRKWADRLEAEGLGEIAEPIRQAADLVVGSNSQFLSAQQKLKKIG